MLQSFSFILFRIRLFFRTEASNLGMSVATMTASGTMNIRGMTKGNLVVGDVRGTPPIMSNPFAVV